jgi:hypothetical protein
VAVDIVIPGIGEAAAFKRASLVWQPGCELPDLYISADIESLDAVNEDEPQTQAMRDSSDIATVDASSRAFALSSETHPVHGTASLMVHACDTGWRLRMLSSKPASEPAESSTEGDAATAKQESPVGSGVHCEPEAGVGAASSSASSVAPAPDSPWERVVAWMGLHLPAAGLVISPAQYMELRAYWTEATATP